MDSPNALLPHAPTLSPGEPKKPARSSRTPTDVNRKELRDRERKSRLRRVEKSETMRLRVAELEKLVLAMQLVPDADSIWDEYVEEDTKTLRGNLRRMLPAVEETNKLTSENRQLEQLVAEHKYTGLVFRQILESSAACDDWETKTHEWKLAARQHFQPWTKDQVDAVTALALEEMHGFERSSINSSGLSFMGWRDSRQIGPDSTVIHFSLSKELRPGHLLQEHLDTGWRIFTQERTYKSVVLGGRGNVSVNIVQKVSPTAWIVHIAEKQDELDVTGHKMLLLSQVVTDEGGVLCMKGFDDASMRSAISGPNNRWAVHSTCVRYESLEPNKGRDSTHYRIHMSGMCDIHPTFLPRWFTEILGVAIRSEAAGLGHWQLTF